LEFLRQPDGFACARIFARENSGWAQVAVWRPLFRVVGETKPGEQSWELGPRRTRQTKATRDSVTFVQTWRDPDGVEWEERLRVKIEPGRPVARLHYEWKAAQPRLVRALLGPNIYI